MIVVVDTPMPSIPKDFSLHLAYDRTFISRRNGSISYNINRNGNIRLDEQKGTTKHRAVPRVSKHVSYALSSTSGHLRCRCFSNCQSRLSASRVVGFSPPTSLAFEDSEPGHLQRDCSVLLLLIPAPNDPAVYQGRKG